MSKKKPPAEPTNAVKGLIFRSLRNGIASAVMAYLLTAIVSPGLTAWTAWTAWIGAAFAFLFSFFFTPWVVSEADVSPLHGEGTPTSEDISKGFRS